MFVSSLKKVVVATLLGMAPTVSCVSFALEEQGQGLRGNVEDTAGESVIPFDNDYDVAADVEADIDQHGRALSSSYYHYSGACRYGGKDKYYKRYKGSQYNYHWCQKKCSSDHKCYAFEHYSKGYDQHCEIWRIKPDGYKKDNYFKCRVKKSAPKPPSGGNYNYKKKYGACRLSKYEDGYKNKHYKRYSWNYHKCAKHCWENHKCKAFEHNGGNHCEIWYYKPTYYKNVGNLKCYLK